MLYRLGRTPPAVPAVQRQRVMFADFVGESLPTPPTVQHWSYAAEDCLSQVYGNDTLSNCTAAGAGHALGVWRGNAKNGDPAPTSDEVIRFYSDTTGYVRGQPSTDQGGNEIEVLTYWRDRGFFPDGSGKILGWADLTGLDPIRVRQAVYLFETLYFGYAMPDAWLPDRNFKQGFTWGAAGPPNPDNGHAFIGSGYNYNGVQVCSWGTMGTVTWEAIAKYTQQGGGELHVPLSADTINRALKRAPNGFDVASLSASMRALT